MMNQDLSCSFKVDRQTLFVSRKKARVKDLLLDIVPIWVRFARLVHSRSLKHDDSIQYSARAMRRHPRGAPYLN